MPRLLKHPEKEMTLKEKQRKSKLVIKKPLSTYLPLKKESKESKTLLFYALCWLNEMIIFIPFRQHFNSLSIVAFWGEIAFIENTL